ncbi:hypothetical protein DL768_007508 [Monosporascus sp. mg162]|nr:hypothetical protein DL768_007508 [Monosporascus sp. mg162]
MIATVYLKYPPSIADFKLGEEEVKLKDEFLDRQYVKSRSSDEQYEREPWEHCRDPNTAYFALRFQERERFRSKLDEEKRKRIKNDLERIDTIREQFSSLEKKKGLIEQLENTKKEWKEEVARNVSNFRRDLQSARKTLQDWRRDAESELPEVLRDLENLWATQLEPKYQRHSMLIRRLEGWRTGESRPNDVSTHLNTNRRGPFFPWRKPSSDQPTQSQPAPAIPEDPRSNNAAGEVGPEPMHGFRACAMHFEKVEEKDIWQGYTYKHPNYAGKFPNQKIEMDKILNKEHENVLLRDCSQNIIRYFHFPANNMSWIETAIARYYNEELPATDDGPTAVKTEKLLARPVQGNQSSNSDSASSHNTRGSFPRKDKNIALFLPYLHWETSSRRAKMVQVINEVMGYEVEPPRLRKLVEEETEKEHSKSRGKPKHESPTKYPRLLGLLGKYLMAVAKVADEMDFEADERLLRKYVKADPPLHIRRTLDQYYFVTLDDTSQRDKDQVVYRGTKAGHSLHTRNTRVVMVDQLWLWILDDNTIITSFPRRWGRNKPDSSGVHKSLRERLEAKRDEIKSIYHLALIIVDQCSRVFFDRTKPLDERPEVMDLFASAIGHVTEMTSIAYDNFWRITALNAKNMLPNNVGSSYLNINPEGVLLKEAQDIAEELQIMKRVYTEQLNVVKDFKRHLYHPTDKDTTQGETAVFKKLLLAIEGNQTASSDAVDRSDDKGTGSKSNALEATLHEAEGALELIKSRQAEIQDLEDSALRTCAQQQASIVEAKAALQRADESVRQGRAIMAFTIVTIFFLPLGFFAAFFGMNNAEINNATWMSLNDQIRYMFGLSALVITISISIAFSPWIRAWIRIFIRVILKIPYHALGKLMHVLGKRMPVQWRWMENPLGRGTLEVKTSMLLRDLKNRPREQEKGKKDAEGSQKTAGAARSRSGPDKAGAAAWLRNGVAPWRESARTSDAQV